MAGIDVRKPGDEELKSLGVKSWPIWEKEASRFDWHYDTEETCFLLAGRVKVTPRGGQPVEFGAGDMVSFPAGMDCTWEISDPVRKHYRLG